jgi:prepilin-type N-terminal cleavage/methylation domain-containing protein
MNGALTRPGGRGGFTLLEILLSLALIGLLLVSLFTFIFSMGELWGRNTDVRLFDLHVRRHAFPRARAAGRRAAAGRPGQLDADHAAGNPAAKRLGGKPAHLRAARGQPALHVAGAPAARGDVLVSGAAE